MHKSSPKTAQVKVVFRCNILGFSHKGSEKMVSLYIQNFELNYPIQNGKMCAKIPEAISVT